ncbi:MAG: hypothetical protein ACI8UO_003662 [Verrucomicrobiales bacterium]|jgi:hypothetical protein
MNLKLLLFLPFFLAGFGLAADPTEQQLANWLKRFPDADANKDGKLTVEEAAAYREKLRGANQKSKGGPQRGTPRTFEVDPGWDLERFPDHAVSYRTPEEIAAIYSNLTKNSPVVSFDKPESGALRIVGTGHSFMAPGYKTFPSICRAAGFEQPLYTHTGGGVTGSARYKWEQENGIFQFDQNPVPKLLASISNAKWDAMMWGPYFQDRPVYYSCWIDFCLKYNPEMKFYLSDAWPQVEQLGEIPTTEEPLTAETFTRLGKEKHAIYVKIVNALKEDYPDKVFIMPTCDAMVLAVQHFHRGELPGIEGINRAIGGKERSLWRDQLGHLGPGFDRLEGYVFYSTIYGRSAELIEGEIDFGGNRNADFPSQELDQTFRKIAWQAVSNNALSGVRDEDGNGIGDDRD